MDPEIKNNNRIFLAALIVFILLISIGVYFFFFKKEVVIEEVLTEKTPHVEMRISETEPTYTVIKDGRIIQTITLSEEAQAGVGMLGGKEFNINTEDVRFINTLDVNFDGHNDLGVLTGIGYGGVNYFYDFYIYNPAMFKFDKNPILVDIGNPELDTANKVLISSYRSGPQWYSVTYAYDGMTFVKSEEVPAREF
jgi:hypothetical protein